MSIHGSWDLESGLAMLHRVVKIQMDTELDVSQADEKLILYIDDKIVEHIEDISKDEEERVDCS